MGSPIKAANQESERSGIRYFALILGGARKQVNEDRLLRSQHSRSIGNSVMRHTLKVLSAIGPCGFSLHLDMLAEILVLYRNTQVLP